MLQLKKYCFFFYLPFLFFNLAAQENYRVIHWDVEQGLSMGNCYAMLKDRVGFLWIATQVGLNRFDGNTFKIYLPDKNKSGEIAGNRIDGLVEDSLHTIWVGTDRGLSRYDMQADTFKNFYPEITTVGSNTFIIPFSATKNEVYCLEPEFKITAYNIHSYNKRIVTGNFHADVGNDFVRPSYSIFDEETNNAWIIDGDGLLQVSLSSNKNVHYSLPSNKTSIHSPSVQGMCFDRLRHCIWLSANEGLFQLELDSNKFFYHDVFKGWENIKSHGTHPGISMDRNGKIWLCTDQQGMMIYDPQNGTVVLPVFDTALRRSISNVNYSIYCDRDGIVWSGAFNYKGFYQLIPFSKVAILYSHTNTPNVLKSEHITAIQNGINKDLWIGSVHGLHIFDVNKNSSHVLSKKDMPGIHSDVIFGLVTDTSSHKAWLHVDGAIALFEMDMDTKKCRPVIFKDSANNIIKNYSLNYLTKGENGCVVRLLKHGIYKVDSDSNIATLIIPLPYQKITSIVSIEDSIIFLRLFGMAGSMTYLHKKNKWILTGSAFDRIPWNYITYNKNDGAFWLGCNFQLMHFDAQFHLLKTYTEKDGLPATGIVSTIVDNNHNLWLTTNNHIAMLNTATDKIFDLSEKDGLEKQKFGWLTPNARDVNGDIYFVGNIGVTRIRPRNFMSFSPAAKIYIQSLEINQHSFAKAKGINPLPVINLRHFENNLSIQTGIIDYYVQGKGNNRIRYRLHGMEASWQYAPANYMIRYVGLSSGNYKLILQASNATGEWNSPQKTLSINIKPAFWNTWWFLSLIAISTLALFYWFMRFKWKQKLMLQKEQAEKERILAEMRYKTVELEMQALRAQMNPHFIFNSLNAINHFILKNESETAANYLVKFSRLIRMVLNNSKMTFIPLEDELETLQLYVDLERLRFKNSFDYTSTCSNGMDTSNICIPPLILQPFVENAIWHGLMHKESKGKLEIGITMENEFLCCTISDNGIGRSNAAIIKSAAAEKIKSMGLSITKSRIGLINEKMEEQQYFVIRDLIDDAGNPAGTIVVLKIKCRQLNELYN